MNSVTKPKHYQMSVKDIEGRIVNIEVIDVVDYLCLKSAKLLNAAQIGYYTQLMNYLMRFSEKNGMEDLLKAKYYLDRIVTQEKIKDADAANYTKGLKGIDKVDATVPVISLADVVAIEDRYEIPSSILHHIKNIAYLKSIKPNDE